ncbi:MAG TPA: carboxypeptidase-like regulatory domain-containing protein, partial [Pyrinomonadaceae bacterium]|nr:carboxypeptidase-like regulatory domain-containing protein [Pyrinomonadaceae bacterium]
PTTYTISGRVANSSNTGIAGVTLTMTGAAGATTQTNTSGNYSFTNVAAGAYTITPSRPGYTFNSASLTLNVTNANLVGNFTAVPLVPAMLTEEGSTTRAVALDSVTQVRGPFPITTLSNFSTDSYTRVMLCASNFVMGPGDDLSIISVQAQGIPLAVESVGKVPGLEASYIVVRLSNQLPAGDLPLTVKLRGVTSSNAVTLGIRR